MERTRSVSHSPRASITGAGTIAVVVIGRHIHEGYEDNAERLVALRRFSWDDCAYDQ